MDIEEFTLERVQSKYENEVDINLTESGIHPFTLRELLPPDEIEALLDVRLGYGWTQGDPGLREAIAARYANAGPENVLVTNGSAEANFATVWSLVGPGDEVVCVLPNYMQIPGLVRAVGGVVRPVELEAGDGRWSLDVDAVARATTERTRMIAVCSPNNPTGAVLDRDTMTALAGIAAERGCWLHADEVYRGAERSGVAAPSFRDVRAHDDVTVVAGLSKALSHPGLRIGWVVGPPSLVEAAWSRTDYTTITSSVLSQRIARYVLESDVVEKILARNRALVDENIGLLEEWLAERPGLFSWTPPEAGAMAFLRYHLDVNSTELSTRLRLEKSTFVVAGDCFGMDGWIRIGLGSPRADFEEGMGRFAELLDEIRRGA